jgi:selenocysteine lyase/cysteine desulfurase
MVKDFTNNGVKADLQTAQNRMFSFVNVALDRLKEEQVFLLLEDPDKLEEQYNTVRQLVFDLLNIDKDKSTNWHMGIGDSGKRTIELLVNYLCPAQPGRNAIVDTENYVGFNKFSAAKALEKQKGVSFDTPFNVELGRALTINAKKEFDKLSQIFKDDRFDTLWLSWNSTSTGVREEIEEIIKCRNAAKSKTIIIADAASFRLFTSEWNNTSSDLLPDVFFFSLRKQGLPYDGPNDEFYQAQNSGALIVFNDKALELANKVNADAIYESPTLCEYADGRITTGEQRANHIKHLLKLNCACDYFLSGNKESLMALDADRKKVFSRIKGAFAHKDGDSSLHFSLFSDPDAQSESSYILKVPESTSAKNVISGLKERGIFISACMHPKMDSKKYVRFAFYPGNSTDEVDYLLAHIKEMA